MDISEITQKVSRLWKALQEKRLDGVLISRRSNFAWITGGGDAHVFLASETGASALLITPKGKYLLAHAMDGKRMMDEEIAGQGWELRQYTWFEGRKATLDELIRGLHIGCDIPGPDFTFLDEAFWRNLEFPLLPAEVNRVREIGRLAEDAMCEVGSSINPGQTELEIGARLSQAFIRQGVYPDVLLVGSDERLYQYRHCLPTPKPVKNLVLMHVAGQKFGLHANITRMVHFGPRSQDLDRRHYAVSYIHSQVLAHLKPGYPYRDLFQVIKDKYAEVGFADEWRGHLQGGVAGYEACYPWLLLDSKAVIGINEAYDWLMTVPGTKSEELSLLVDQGIEVPSVLGGWPVLQFDAGGLQIRLPDILERS